MPRELSYEQRLAVLAALVDGNSERAIERTTRETGEAVMQKTIGRFALRLGRGAQNLHNARVHDLVFSLAELDEIWSYVGKKQARVTPAEHAAGLGEAYTFVGFAMPARFVVTWKTGKRDDETCSAFVEDFRARCAVMPTLMTSDGFVPYISAIGKHMGPGVNYAQTVKNYRSGGRKDDHRYEPPRDPFVTKHAVFGAPDLDAATTAHLERFNGTTRHINGRMRRLVYAFSKDPERHAASVALHYVYYNFCWIPRTTRVTPAMAIGVTDHVWDLRELLDALLRAEPCAAPMKKPIVIPEPATTSRALPGGRGFLRVVPKAGGPAAPPPGPATPPPAPEAPAPPVQAAADPSGQLDLLAWRPRPERPLPPPGSQLSLFGEDQ